MPEKLVRCVQHVMAKGMPKSHAWPICINATGLHPEPRGHKTLPADNGKHKRHK